MEITEKVYGEDMIFDLGKAVKKDGFSQSENIWERPMAKCLYFEHLMVVFCQSYFFISWAKLFLSDPYLWKRGMVLLLFFSIVYCSIIFKSAGPYQNVTQLPREKHKSYKLKMFLIVATLILFRNYVYLIHTYLAMFFCIALCVCIVELCILKITEFLLKDSIEFID